MVLLTILCHVTDVGKININGHNGLSEKVARPIMNTKKVTNDNKRRSTPRVNKLVYSNVEDNTLNDIEKRYRA